MDLILRVHLSRNPTPDEIKFGYGCRHHTSRVERVPLPLTTRRRWMHGRWWRIETFTIPTLEEGASLRAEQPAETPAPSRRRKGAHA